MKNDEFLVEKIGLTAIVYFRNVPPRDFVLGRGGAARGRGGSFAYRRRIFLSGYLDVVRYPPGCGASSNGWNWNIALKPWPGHSELATNSTYRSDPVLSTSTSAPWLHSIAIVAAPESVPSCTLIKSALFRQL